jgi:hypothetical protein
MKSKPHLRSVGSTSDIKTHTYIDNFSEEPISSHDEEPSNHRHHSRQALNSYFAQASNYWPSQQVNSSNYTTTTTTTTTTTANNQTSFDPIIINTILPNSTTLSGNNNNTNCNTNDSTEMQTVSATVFFGVFIIVFMSCCMWLCLLLGNYHEQEVPPSSESIHTRQQDLEKRRQKRLKRVEKLMHARVWCQEDEIRKQHAAVKKKKDNRDDLDGAAEDEAVDLTEQNSSIDNDDADNDIIVVVDLAFCQPCAAISPILPDLEQGVACSANHTTDKDANINDNDDKTASSFSTVSFDETHIPCPICLTVFENGDQVCQSNHPDSCSHVFHSECIKSWLIDHGECPMCREPFL